MSSVRAIGPYAVLATLGRGGMGTVFKVRGPDAQIRALKLLDKQSLEFLHRFKREFRAAAQLKHHNIVAVHEMGQDGPYFTMEYVEGGNLLSYVRDEGRSGAIAHPGELRRLFFSLGQILKALDYIHSHGIVHRDIKPDNILVNREGAIKISDFGLAKVVSGDSFVTDRQTILGTVAYVAPEQASGAQVDGRTDLYALGVVLYQLLTGTLPFEHKNAITLLDRKLSEDQPADPRALNTELPDPWAELCLKLLKREPSERYQGIPELFTELRQIWRLTAGKRAPAAKPFDDEELLTGARAVLTAPRFVGREREMERLDSLLDGVAAGKGGTLLVSGEAGSGKSRIIEELRLRARARGLKVAVGRPTGRAAFSCFRRILERTAGRMKAWSPEDIRTAVTPEGRALTRLVPQFATLDAIAELPQPEPLQPRQSHDRDLRVLTALFASLAGRSPSLLVIDDLQDGDGASLDLTRLLAVRSAELKLGLVASFRRGATGTAAGLLSLLTESRASGAEHVSIGGLSEEAVAELLSTMLGGERPEAEVVARLHAETDGNPFYLEEVVKVLVGAQALTRRSGQWCIDRAAFEQVLPERRRRAANPGVRRLPDGIAKAVRGRVELLTPSTRNALEVAALASDTFTPELLRAVTRETEESLLDALAQALNARLIVEVAGRRDSYRFHHDRVRDVLLERLPAEGVRRLHAIVGRALENLGGATPDAVELAYHFGRAGDSKKALEFLPRAARSLAASYDNEEAHATYARAIALVEGMPAVARASHASLLVELAYEAGALSELLGRLGDALSLYQKAHEAATESGNEAAAAAAQAAMAGLVWLEGDYARAEWLASESLRRAERVDAPDVKARALDALGLVARRVERFDDALAFFEAALSIREQLGDRLAIAKGLANLGVIALKRDQTARALHYFRRSLTLDNELDNKRGVSRCLGHLGSVHLKRCEYDDALARYREALDIDTQIGNLRGQAYCQASIGTTQLTRGDYAAAAASFERALFVFRDLPDRQNEARALLNLGHVAFRSDEILRCLGLYEGALAILEELGDRAGLAEVYSSLALAEGRLGRKQRAIEHARLATSRARETGIREKEAWAWLSLSRVIDDGEDLQAARRSVELAQEAEDRNLTFQALGQLAVCCRRRGDESGAAQSISRALVIIDSIVASLDSGREAFLARPAVREIYAIAGRKL